MLSLKVKGVWLSTLGAVGPIKFGTSEHGPDSVTWTMAEDFWHPILRGNALVEVFDGGFRIGLFTMVEPAGDGTYAARGLWMQGQIAACMDGANAVSMVADTAVFTAIVTTGELNWALPTSLSTTAYGPADPSINVARLLDGVAAEQGKRWSVNANREVRLIADPVSPKWIVPHAVYGKGLTPAEDEFYTHLTGAYLDSTSGTYKYRTVGSATAAANFGRRTKLYDLSGLGSTSAARADAVLNGMLSRVGPRMGFGEPISLVYGQITTQGGAPAPLTQIQYGQVVRLAGTIDISRPSRIAGYTDIVVAGTDYDEESRTIRITPQGYAPRNFEEILELALSEVAA